MIVVMGHVDHGKSALLDYIRKSNVVAGEAGGITQHISAYEVEHSGKKITFLDTPGHAAFSAMRARGASVADIAVLVVSAEDGVKAQTLEALGAIKSAGIPYVVAINKIDLPAADVQRTKNTLIEHEIYIEGMGGDVPWNAISAKTGEGVSELLDTLLLVAEIAELKGDTSKRATGVVVESRRDAKKGVAATLVITDGSIREGQYVVAGSALAPVRIMENFMGSTLSEAHFSSPIALVGFDSLPEVGAHFSTYDTKKDAELARSAYKRLSVQKRDIAEGDDRYVLGVVLKADAAGSVEAIEHELAKLDSAHSTVRVLESGTGTIGEGDIKVALASTNTVVVGFHTSADATAVEVARQHGVIIKEFTIIYELAEWVRAHIGEHRPKVAVEQTVGESKILAIFSESRNAGHRIQTVGGRVLSGQMRNGRKVALYSHDGELVGNGKVLTLQVGKQSTETVNTEQEFGTQIQTDTTLDKGMHMRCLELVME